MAAFRGLTFLTVLNPTLTPRHPTAERAHATHSRTCLAPSRPCSVERTFRGQGHRCRVMELNALQTSQKEAAWASYKVALCMPAITCITLPIFRHALVGYTAQVPGIRLNILFNTHGTMKKREKPRRVEKN